LTCNNHWVLNMETKCVYGRKERRRGGGHRLELITTILCVWPAHHVNWSCLRSPHPRTNQRWGQHSTPARIVSPTPADDFLTCRGAISFCPRRAGANPRVFGITNVAGRYVEITRYDVIFITS
jgi:hypothetical protein